MKRFIMEEMGTYIVSPVKHKAMADDFTPTAGLLDFFALLSVPLLVRRCAVEQPCVRNRDPNEHTHRRQNEFVQ
jgi:hypothetical protein